MVRKLIEKSIEEAMSRGRQNQQTHRYLNWCKHLSIKLLSRSPLGQATQLPLGMHEIYCDYYSGGQSVNVELIATSFIEQNCVDCPFHDEIHPDNQGRVIVGKVLEQRQKLGPALLARQKLKELAQVSDPTVVLGQDVVSDQGVTQLLLLLEDRAHRQQAAQKILSVAQDLDVRLFGVDAVRVLSIYFADPDIGGIIIQVARTLCARQHALFEVVVEPAKYVFRDGHHQEALAYLLGDYVIATADISGVVETVPLLMDHHTMMMGVGSHKPSKGAIHAVQAIAKVDTDPILQAVNDCLARGDKYSRLEACDTLDFLIGDHTQLGDIVFDSLLNSLNFEDDHYERSADMATINLLAKIALPDLVGKLPVIEQFYENSKPDVKAIVFSLYERLAEKTDNKTIQDRCALRAIHLLVAGIEHIEILESCAKFLERLARKRPAALYDKCESLISALTFQIDRPAEIRQTEVKNHLDGLNRENLALQWESIVNHTQEAIERVGQSNPEAVAQLVRHRIENTNSKIAARLKARLISILGKLSQESLAVAQTSVPLLFGLLVDNDSPLVRGNAAEAFGQMSNYRQGILPKDVLDLLKELLLHETNAYVLTKLFRAFQNIHITDSELAISVCNALASWEPSFNNDPGTQVLIGVPALIWTKL